MNINYDYYRIFYFVAKYGNISQAAKLLLNNQPNLTRTIKNLESELGCPLFSRTNRGMRLTPEGQKLYEHIKVAIEHIEAGDNREQEFADGHGFRRGERGRPALPASASAQKISYALSRGSHTHQQPLDPAGNSRAQGRNGGYRNRHDSDRPLRIAERNPASLRARGGDMLAGIQRAARQKDKPRRSR